MVTIRWVFQQASSDSLAGATPSFECLAPYTRPPGDRFGCGLPPIVRRGGRRGGARDIVQLGNRLQQLEAVAERHLQFLQLLFCQLAQDIVVDCVLSKQIRIKAKANAIQPSGDIYEFACPLVITRKFKAAPATR